MERSVTVRTPESVAFSYELAGLGSRFLAVALDQLLQFSAVIVVFLIWVVAISRLGNVAIRASASRPEATHLGVWLTVVLAIVVFAIEFVYFMVFEAIWNGQTPGKRLMGIRVVRDGGYAVDFMAVLLRNVVRVVEALIGFYLMSVISALISHQNKRLGDLAAGTIVVRDRAFEVSNPARWLSGDEEVAPGRLVAGVESLSPEEVAVVQRYIERRTLLPPKVAGETAARIASALRPKLSPDAARLSDDELLVRVAASRRI